MAESGEPRSMSWRPEQPSNRRWRGGRWFAIAGLIVVVILVVVLIVNLVLAPLHAWRTGLVMLAFDAYEPRMFEPVPFCREDIAALSSRLGGDDEAAGILPPLEFEGLDSAEVVRASLGPRCGQLGMRRKDVLVAYVRGQTFVVPPRFNTEGSPRNDPLTGRPCLFAADCSVRGQVVTGVVPIREVVEAIGSATNYTTLVAIDMGSLGWDPRLGIVSPLVPACLDDEFTPPQEQATFANWVIGSHDTFEASWASGPDRRTFFSRAMELALAGEADKAPWGDQDGIVELDELARFVTALTSEWVSRASGGRYTQRPVVWKIGTGRVPLAAIPQGIAIVRVQRLSPPESKPLKNKPSEAPKDGPAPTTTSAIPGWLLKGRRQFPMMSAALLQSDSGKPAKNEGAKKEQDDQKQANDTKETRAKAEPPKDGSATVPAGGSKAATASTDPGGKATAVDPKESMPAEPQPPPVPPTLWELVDIGTRRTDGPDSTALPIDYASHIWRTVVAQSAAVTVRLDRASDESEREQASRGRDGLWNGLAELFSPKALGLGPVPPVDVVTVVERLNRAKRAATAGGFFDRWSVAPARFRTAVATRNDTAERLLATSDLMARVALGAGTPRIEPRILLDCSRQVASLSTAIARLADFEEDVTLSQSDSLESISRAVATERSSLDAVNASMVEGMVDRSVATGVSLDGNVATAALRVPGLGAKTRRSLFPVLGSGESREMVAGVSLLTPIGPLAVDTSPRRVSSERAENVRAHCDLLLRAMEAAGLTPIGSDRVPGPLVWPLERMAAVRRAAELVTKPLNDGERVKMMLSLAGRLAHLYAEIADSADGVARETQELAAVDRIASLFRVVSHRDVMRIGELPDIRLPRWHKPDRLGLRLESVEDGFHDTDAPLAVTVVTAGAAMPADDAVVRFRYDPADFTLSTTSGDPLLVDRVYRSGDLPFRSDGLALHLTANRQANTASDRLDTELTIIVESGGRRDVASKRFSLPDERSIRLAARRLPLMMAAAEWTYSMARPSLGGSPLEWREALLPLTVPAGRPSALAMTLENGAEIDREVSVAVYSIPSGPEPGSRARAWHLFRQRLLEGAEPSAKLLGRIESLIVPASGGQSLIALPPPAPPEPLPPPPEAGPAAGAALELVPQPVGPDLAVAVQERTKGEPPRSWLHRVGLLTSHPRDVLVATATWRRDTRTIAIEIGPRDGAPLTELTRCRLVPLPAAPVAGQQSIAIRREAVVLTPESPRQSMLADWNGAERDARAWLAVSVDGYPRAFVFGVECSAASAGQSQQPLSDWRAIAIREPRQAEQELKAPLPTIPLTLQVDAPPDSAVAPFTGDRDTTDELPTAPLLSVLLRERDQEAGPARSEAIVWSAAADRQIEFVPAPPRPDATLVVEPRVTDWSIAPSSNGYVDVDVLVEARLSIPGVQAPLTDRRRLRLDGKPPRIELPPLMNAQVGRPLTVPVLVLDDPREAFGATSGIDLPGVTGVQRVDWAIDLAGTGKPEAWQPAVGLGEGRYELRVDTKQLPPGRQTPVLVRAVDRVGNMAEPSRVWIETRALAAKNGIRGRVMLNGRGEAGVSVQLDGPAAPAPTTSGKDGSFQFDQLDAGSYTVRASGAVRNRLYRADPQPVVVDPPPAEPPRITIELKPK